jgi:hypothetical protein
MNLDSAAFKRNGAGEGPVPNGLAGACRACTPAGRACGDRARSRTVQAPAAIDGLERRIREKLAASAEARRLRQDELWEASRDLDWRLKRYTTVADRIMEAVIRTGMETLAECFAGAQSPEVQRTRHTCVCRFPHTPRFPATAAVELGVTRDGDARIVTVEYDLQILPVFHPINAQARLVMPLDEMDEREVARWVEERVLEFVDSYLRLETVEPYREE